MHDLLLQLIANLIMWLTDCFTHAFIHRLVHYIIAWLNHNFVDKIFKTFLLFLLLSILRLFFKVIQNALNFIFPAQVQKLDSFDNSLFGFVS